MEVVVVKVRSTLRSHSSSQHMRSHKRHFLRVLGKISTPAHTIAIRMHLSALQKAALAGPNE